MDRDASRGILGKPDLFESICDGSRIQRGTIGEATVSEGGADKRRTVIIGTGSVALTVTVGIVVCRGNRPLNGRFHTDVQDERICLYGSDGAKRQKQNQGQSCG